MIREEKSWGYVFGRSQTEKTETMECYINEGGFSSIHKHEFKHNAFWVISGVLLIKVFEFNGVEPKLDRTHTVSAVYNLLVIKAGIIHQFVAKTNVVLVETYYAVNSPIIKSGEHDIVRYNKEN